ncbi:hypothetical protein [Chryseobacterium sp. MMS23-Vi53]|uniref:hypothetical protein n=1 Tax=Chryseobacterium sp. MMS23-Vi53 TaxID=3386644 RepID=UPI0039EB3663
MSKKELIIKLILAFSIEYKLSIISIKNKADFGNENNDTLGISKLIASQNGKEYTKNSIELFCEKYKIGQNEYFFFNSIFDNVIKLKDFEAKEFKVEAIENFKLKIENGELLEHYKIYNELNFDKIVNYTEEQYKNLCDKLLAFAFNGSFKPYEMFGVYQRIIFLDNILGYDLEDITQKLITGIQKYVDENEIEIDDLRQFQAHSRSEYTSRNTEIRENGLRLLKNKNDFQLKDKCLQEINKIINNEINVEIGNKLDGISSLLENDFLVLIGHNTFFDLTKDSTNSVFESLVEIFTLNNKLDKEILKSYISLLEDYQEEFEEKHNDKLRNYFYKRYLKFIKEN